MKAKQRIFREADLPDIIEFKKKSFGISFPGQKFHPDKFRNAILKSFGKEPEGIQVLEDGREVIGYVWMSTRDSDSGKHGLIHHIFIKESHRKMGLAAKLMNYAEEYFRKKGIDVIKLTVTIDNGAAVRLYEKLGYTKKRIVMEKGI
jgi:ribosomal protein S18 acetylase RimI-like enzyme